MPPMHDTRRMFAGRRARFHRRSRSANGRAGLEDDARRGEDGRSGAFTLITVVHEMAGPRPRHHRGAGHRLPRGRRSRLRHRPRRRRKRRATDEPGMVARASCSIPCCCSAIRRLPSTPTASTMTCPIPASIEGYPALVMNGGLTALLLVETARQHLPGRSPAMTRAPCVRCSSARASRFNGRLAGDRPSCGRRGPTAGSTIAST